MLTEDSDRGLLWSEGEAMGWLTNAPQALWGTGHRQHSRSPCLDATFSHELRKASSLPNPGRVKRMPVNTSALQRRSRRLRRLWEGDRLPAPPAFPGSPQSQATALPPTCVAPGVTGHGGVRSKGFTRLRIPEQPSHYNQEV